VISAGNSATHDPLDAWGRYLLQLSDYRDVGVCIVLLWLVFVGIRRLPYRSWPPVADHVTVIMGIFSLWGVLVQAVVFLMTKPPALELLSQTDLVLVSVVCLVVVFVVVGPAIFRLFFPAEVRSRISVE
jgi:hypothetical protein